MSQSLGRSNAMSMGTGRFGATQGSSLGNSLRSCGPSTDAGSMHSQQSAASMGSQKTILIDAADFATWWPSRRFCHRFVEGKFFPSVILGVIFLNTALIVFQTNPETENRYGWYFTLIDNVFLGIYIFEVIVKYFVFRKKYWKSGWNVFDFGIVISSFLDWLTYAAKQFAVVNPKMFRLVRVFRALRALRALRVLRTISFLRNLQIIVNTVLRSIPALASIFMLLSLLLYIFAINGRQLYGHVHPDRFGNIWSALFSLFQLITLDDWFDFYAEVREVDRSIIIYLVVFILLETFILINLFIAVIVNNLEASLQQLYARRPTRRKRRGADQGGGVPEKDQEDIDDVDAPATVQDEERDVNFYYANQELPLRGRRRVGQYFMLLASVERHNMDVHDKQRLLDDLVDLSEAQESALKNEKT